MRPTQESRGRNPSPTNGTQLRGPGQSSYHLPPERRAGGPSSQFWMLMGLEQGGIRMEKPPKPANRSGEALQSPNQGPARKLTALHKFIFFQRRMAGPPPAPQASYPKADTSQLGIGGTVCLLTRHLGATRSVGAGLPFQPPADNAPPAPAGLHGPRPTQQVPAPASPLVFSSAMAPRCLVRRNSQGPAQARLRWG